MLTEGNVVKWTSDLPSNTYEALAEKHTQTQDDDSCSQTHRDEDNVGGTHSNRQNIIIYKNKQTKKNIYYNMCRIYSICKFIYNRFINVSQEFFPSVLFARMPHQDLEMQLQTEEFGH